MHQGPTKDRVVVARLEHSLATDPSHSLQTRAESKQSCSSCDENRHTVEEIDEKEEKALDSMKNELIIVSNLKREELERRIARGSFQLEKSALKDTHEIKCRLHAISELMMIAKHDDFIGKPSDDQAANACSIKNWIASSVGRI